MKKEIKRGWGKYILFILVMVIGYYSFTLCKVEGESMQPTLYEADYVFVNKAVVRLSNLQRGEIVIIKEADESKYYVKRVIGLPGDVINITNGKVYVNDKKQEEPYTNKDLFNNTQVFYNFQKTKIPPNKLFVMGDNREVSRDSRNGLGYIEEDNIIGKVEFVYYPFSKMKMIE
ncbi:signal peptidase I [Bacillus thuringiensis]|uniref:Signal peptidase I n=1 Tax=Bacillus cereus HuB4-4 TaxID=1053211 RepID=A0A9W5QTR6_BACCE|nr:MULTISPECIES: signal peptidase I [Bacillus cereus group]EOP87695.1 signal peptidase I [Bacillus cereus HuB4-4]MCU5550913.1 signal peptidase I [Bacillus cereus]MED3579502.1 signal peptidase I [Bacillus thuringiensis]PFF55109.1 signal peptidase I [Bacillus thuringiensis]PGQ22062.1 signal peptidase I [Bacillus thuringiensis]